MFLTLIITNVSWAPNHYIEWFMEDRVTLKAEQWLQKIQLYHHRNKLHFKNILKWEKKLILNAALECIRAFLPSVSETDTKCFNYSIILQSSTRKYKVDATSCLARWTQTHFLLDWGSTTVHGIRNIRYKSNFLQFKAWLETIKDLIAQL